jgi:A/G-specific adenine glycosylase
MMRASKAISRKLLGWFRKHARDLPWRRTKDPYLIWVSEVMLQQTQVATVIPYYLGWSNTLPDVQSLALADEDSILKLWEGLGYYKRALNLKRAAEVVINEFGGRIPSEIDKLKRLPGIGDYIAGAVASIAFELPEPALDGNGIRVLSRLLDFRKPVDKPVNRLFLKDWLKTLLVGGFAGEINQAIMDLGSEICKPKNADCLHCPLSRHCLALQRAAVDILPVKSGRRPIPHYDVVAAVIRKQGKLLVDKRDPNGLLGGLWEFPGGKVEPGEKHAEALMREIREELGVEIKVGDKIGIYRHAYTHYRVTVHVHFCEIISGQPQAFQSSEIQWVKPHFLEELPMGKVDRLISTALNANL